MPSGTRCIRTLQDLFRFICCKVFSYILTFTVMRQLAALGFEPLIEVFPDKEKAGTLPFLVTATLLVAYRAGSRANAHTGMVPSPSMRSGTAVKEAPVGGSCSRPVRCSTAGMPAASCRVCAGVSPSAVSSMLTASMPTSAGSRARARPRRPWLGSARPRRTAAYRTVRRRRRGAAPPSRERRRPRGLPR